MNNVAAELNSVVTDLILSRRSPGRDDYDVLWTDLVDLGLRDVGLDEALGGSGGSLAELTQVVATLAEHGVAVPIVEFSTGRWAQGVAGLQPSNVIAVAGPESPSEDGDLTDVVVPWGRYGDAVILERGTAVHVLDVDPNRLMHAESVSGEPLDVLPLTDVDWQSARSLPIHGSQLRRRLRVLRIAELVGASRGAVDLSRRYVAQREQFGAPLVAIPAVARNIALMRVSLRQGEAALVQALAASETPPAEAVPDHAMFATTAALVTAERVSNEIAEIAHQVHGALGVTEEYPLHKLTRKIWAVRDLQPPAVDLQLALGGAVVEYGEEYLWSVTAAGVPGSRFEPTHDKETAL
ncbi:acyl-CoA dehydrogenase family protein [Mycolicibacterium sp. P9-22]|uniref:acyl-CoA dehydrogenase family protein n=1 Tax=Mycolicibacterium sp. P9-22 TaxID=2024613 RepID=UPI0011F027D0|nr:acyl-CoA dehydrogenase family protein [Mycolicibacterium sp. P9-22]KAA0114665.1 hypothetical protein CIW51_20550 [Mycolicibacterium sp. P9-22]